MSRRRLGVFATALAVAIFHDERDHHNEDQHEEEHRDPEDEAEKPIHIAGDAGGLRGHPETGFVRGLRENPIHVATRPSALSRLERASRLSLRSMRMMTVARLMTVNNPPRRISPTAAKVYLPTLG